ncbi:Rpn family recombination-promoting nuclease/putative transposase [Leptolyngbya sp. AN03gr2]|uniref:Rpn family recombination-promoting nuclease/putative transposase n=1 Tax=unclassified Leptolyngbya TaxID=2650499 RepID=UPI003D31250F
MARIFEGLLDVAFHIIFIEPYIDPNEYEGVDLEAAFRGQINGICGAASLSKMLLMTGLHTGPVRFTKIIDLLAEVQLAGEDAAILIHIEAQASAEANFTRRMFFYFARLYQKYLQRVYPIVVFSFDDPYREEPHHHIVEFPNLKVLEFNFASVQLNRLNWRDFLNQPNPVAAALMSKMRIAVEDRPRVKAECLRVLATLRLDPARIRLISGFVDTYLKLNAQEQQAFQSEIARIEPVEREEIMEIVTSWMQEGIEQGKREGELSLVSRQLNSLFGETPTALQNTIDNLSVEQLESLGLALIRFTKLEDLEIWLQEHQD